MLNKILCSNLQQPRELAVAYSDVTQQDVLWTSLERSRTLYTIDPVEYCLLLILFLLLWNRLIPKVARTVASVWVQSCSCCNVCVGPCNPTRVSSESSVKQPWWSTFFIFAGTMLWLVQECLCSLEVNLFYCKECQRKKVEKCMESRELRGELKYIFRWWGTWCKCRRCILRHM